MTNPPPAGSATTLPEAAAEASGKASDNGPTWSIKHFVVGVFKPIVHERRRNNRSSRYYRRGQRVFNGASTGTLSPPRASWVQHGCTLHFSLLPPFLPQAVSSSRVEL